MKAIVLFAGAFVGSFASFAARDVKATGWERVSPAACLATLADSNFVYMAAGTPYSNFTGGTMSVICGVNDSNLFDIAGVQGKQNISTLNIHGEDRHASAYVWAKACVSYFHTTGGECGTLASSGGSYLGQYTLQPSRSKWGPAFAGHFGHIFIVLPSNTGNGASTFSGYFVGAP